MSRSTRSSVHLPGNIRDYCVDKETMAPVEEQTTPAGDGVDLQSVMSQLSGDPAKIAELLATMWVNQNKNQNTGGSGYYNRVDNCPTKGKYSSLEAWIQEVELWDESHVNTSNSASINAKKYLKFMDSVRTSEDSDELKKLVQVEFVENQAFNKKSDTIIQDMVKKIKEKLGNTDLEKCSEAWLKFIDIKQERDETSQAFVVRFEQAETHLSNVKIKIPNKALAIHLLNRTNLEPQSKENILTKTDLDDDEKIYTTLKKSIREMKSKLTQTVAKEDPVEKKVENKTFYGHRGRSGSRYNSRSDGHKNRSYSRGRNSRQSDNKGYSRDSESFNEKSYNKPWKGGKGDQDKRSRDSSRGNRYERRNSWKRSGDRSSSRHGERNQSHSYRDGSKFNKRRNSSSDKEVNMVHFSQYEFKDKVDNSEFRKFSCNVNDDIDKKIIEVVYSEGNLDVDPYKLVVDCGCPKTVTGKPWMDAFMESKGFGVIRRENENEYFKFGPSNSEVYKSNENYEIEVSIGTFKDKIKVSVVDADIPLLLGLDYQEKWGMIIDLGKKEITIRKSNEKLKINPNSKHWTLPIQDTELHTRARNLVFNVNCYEYGDLNLRKHITKVHKNLSHKSEDQMLKLYKMAGKDTKRIRATIKNVVSTCNICNRFRKTPARPKVALAKANTTNEVVSVDLKVLVNMKKNILYMCDEFSGFMAAKVINDKEPETVIKAFDKKWIKEGPGIPSKGIFADNGGEFKNPKMKEVSAKYGLSLSLTAGRSPWSNGKIEREHFTCDLIVEKLMEEDPKLKLDEAVSLAVYAKNLQINRTGFSPRQLMFGKQGVVPGISDGNPASMEAIVESDNFRSEFINRQKAEELFRKYDSNERIQKILAQRTYGYSDQKYQEGQMVLFKEEGKNRWSGPGKVTGMEGSKVRIIHAGYDRTVPSCRVMPFKDELEVIDNNSEYLDVKTDETAELNNSAKVNEETQKEKLLK